MIDSSYLIAAYAQGIFPMGMDDGEIGWFSPDPRGILPLESFHYSSRLARLIRQDKFEIVIDADFAGVMRACAADRDEGTWITDEIVESYVALHRRGLAHSVEVRQKGELVGGLYGVHLGSAFFGESMFHTVTDASKVALVGLVQHMKQNGFTLLDTQWTTPHLAQFGGIEIPKADYITRLDQALSKPADF